MVMRSEDRETAGESAPARRENTSVRRGILQPKSGKSGGSRQTCHAHLSEETCTAAASAQTKVLPEMRNSFRRAFNRLRPS